MNQNLSYRKYVIAFLFVAIGVVYIMKLFGLQVMDSTYKLSAQNNVFRKITDYPARGLIFDRDSNLLVYNEATYDLKVIPNQVQEFDTLDLCNILGISKEEFLKRLDKAIDHSPYKASDIYTQITKARFAYLQEKLHKFPGFFVQARSARRYIYPIAAHFLGYVREVDSSIIRQDSYYKMGDFIGVQGLEKSYEKYLRGVKGSKIQIVDVFNRVKGSYRDGKYDTAAIVGKNVVSTISLKLQQYGEELMNGKNGSIVAIEPSTGEILCLVSNPSYNPNLLIGSDIKRNYPKLLNNKLKPLFNRALMAQYPPGSIFKLVNALIGLQEGVITTSSSYTCGGGFNIGSHIVGCHHLGSINFLRSIQGSCNTYYCNVYTRILNDPKYADIASAYTNWRNHVLSFGLGKKLDSDLNRELKGIVYTSEHYDKYYGKGRWKSYTLISMAIGQGELGFTPIQMANMVATIANKGYYIIPHIVKRIEGEEGIEKKYLEKHYTKIDKKYFEPVIEGMELVVRSGTATSAFVEDIRICGKTGTAQNPHGDDHSIFVAFAPRENPQIAISVYVENAGYGSTYAAPIASLMIEHYLKGKTDRKYLEDRMKNAILIEELKSND